MVASRGSAGTTGSTQLRRIGRVAELSRAGRSHLRTPGISSLLLELLKRPRWSSGLRVIVICGRAAHRVWPRPHSQPLPAHSRLLDRSGAFSPPHLASPAPHCLPIPSRPPRMSSNVGSAYVVSCPIPARPGAWYRTRLTGAGGTPGHEMVRQATAISDRRQTSNGKRPIT